MSFAVHVIVGILEQLFMNRFRHKYEIGEIRAHYLTKAKQISQSTSIF